MSKKYSCGVIGLGAIGMGYDFHEDNKILTHVRAILSHPCFELLCAVDPCQLHRINFQKRYSINAYETINDIPADLHIDVFAVCTPTHLHLESIAEILDRFSPLALLCEKPIFNNYDQANLFFSELKNSSSVKIYVNYIRRSDCSARVISQLIQKEDNNFLVKGSCYYTKGALNNASHFLNLLESWFGPVKLQPLSSFYSCEVEGDFNIDFVANFDNATVVFHSGIESTYSLYQFQLYFSSGILSYTNGGADIFYLPREYIASCPRPFLKPWQRINSDLTNYQYHVYEELLNALNGRPSWLSTQSDALATLNALSSLKNHST